MGTVKATWAEFSARYCDTQEQTPEGLAAVLRAQIDRYSPDGFFMAEAQLMDSSWFGQVVILPYGPDNTFKTVPERPFSPRGLASDTSVAIRYLVADDVPGDKTDDRVNPEAYDANSTLKTAEPAVDDHPLG